MSGDHSTANNTVYHTTPNQWLFLVWIDVLSFVGIIGYVQVCRVVAQHKKITFKNSFFTFVLSRAIPEVIILLLNFIFVTPTIIFGRENMYSWYSMSMGFLFCWAAHSVLTHMIAMSFNRFAAVTMIQRYQSLFTNKKLTLIITICYLYALIETILFYYCGSVEEIGAGYGWTVGWYGDDINCFMTYLQYGEVASALDVIIPAVLHIGIIIRVRKAARASTDSTRQHLAKEKPLVVQFGLMFLIYVVYTAVFWIIYMSVDAMNTPAVQWIFATVGLLNYCLDPFLYMTFGSDVKRYIFSNSVAPSEGVKLSWQ